MRLLRLIIPVSVAISIIIFDHKFNTFVKVKQVLNFMILPVHYVVNLPPNIYQLLNNNEQIKQDDSNKLLSLSIKIQQYNSLLLENQKLSSILNSSYQIQNENLKLARITSVKQSRLKKHIVINKGTAHKVNKGQAVLGDKGVIGVIIQSNNDNSVVRLITDPLQYIPVINSRNGEKGIAKGMANNLNQLIIKYINPSADIEVGDVFITSSQGGVFNHSYHLGVVSEILQDNQEFISIILNPSQSINDTIFVMVDGSNN